jgi:hypothetical protein
VDPVDKSLVALLQQTVRLVQYKEPALPEHNQSINQSDPADKSLVALFQQAVRLVQHKEPALPEHNQSINQTLLINPS